jgi:hypothetical protein
MENVALFHFYWNNIFNINKINIKNKERFFSSLNSISEEDLVNIKSLESYIDKGLVNNIQNKERMT